MVLIKAKGGLQIYRRRGSEVVLLDGLLESSVLCFSCFLPPPPPSFLRCIPLSHTSHRILRFPSLCLSLQARLRPASIRQPMETQTCAHTLARTLVPTRRRRGRLSCLQQARWFFFVLFFFTCVCMRMRVCEREERGCSVIIIAVLC